MKIRATIVSVVASMVLALCAHAELVTIHGYLTQGNNLGTPPIDVWNVKCASVPTAIRARVAVFSGVEDVLHVTVLCLEPLTQRGKGDKEIGSWPERNGASEWAEAPSCREAFVELGCDYSAPCNTSNYLIQMECQGAAFLPGSFNYKINR